eukprot:TRINITY_DN683_c0_g1_i3.p3 TRINITY_DN683_c0_g1~~TRINITY_DN683_c0_g1_i3.p3  ORF type:complete len:142 (+),score=45.04 TRINITY_DN683_c0_g1_i3:594-1019(+)
MVAKKTERSKKINMFMELESKKTLEKSEKINLITSYQRNARSNDSIMKEQIEDQKKSLRSKIERKRKMLKLRDHLDASKLKTPGSTGLDFTDRLEYNPEHESGNGKLGRFEDTYDAGENGRGTVRELLGELSPGLSTSINV